MREESYQVKLPTPKCEVCEGLGRVMIKGNSYNCPACNGTGDAKNEDGKTHETKVKQVTNTVIGITIKIGKVGWDSDPRVSYCLDETQFTSYREESLSRAEG